MHHGVTFVWVAKADLLDRKQERDNKEIKGTNCITKGINFLRKEDRCSRLAALGYFPAHNPQH